jgi:hypothetical protein
MTGNAATPLQRSQQIGPSEYDRTESEWRNGLCEIRLEDGFIITCLTPRQ